MAVPIDPEAKGLRLARDSGEVVTCATLGLAACGGGGTGVFGQQVRSYTVTLTGASGGLSHSTTVNLTVE